MIFQHAYLPPHLAAQFARERVDLNGLRDFVAIEVDRLIDFLDTLDGDPDFEADYSTVEQRPDGSLFTLGRSTDDEPSLGSPNFALPGIPLETVNAKATQRLPNEPFAVGAADDREHDDADGPEGDDEREEENEHGGDIQDEPHDREEDRGSDEDEGILGYHLARPNDPLAAVRACEARLDLDMLLNRTSRRPAPVGNCRMVTVIGPGGERFRAFGL